MVREFDDIHEDHINISRFANHSPFVFATSSFDKTVRDQRTVLILLYRFNEIPSRSGFGRLLPMTALKTGTVNRGALQSSLVRIFMSNKGARSSRSFRFLFKCEVA